MLNVLCLKTLEQARMEVLEEQELAIMKKQKKEYEEVRNAELIEAQRFEAAEARVKAEKHRRANQQKARKAHKKLAHQKHVSRVIAKNYLVGLRERAIQTLSDMNLLHPKIESDLHKDVLPWLTARRDSFLGDQTSAGELAEGLIEKGLVRRRETHARTLQARIERKQKEEQDLLRAGEMQAQRRADRKIAREKREKEQAKQKMRDEIRRILIEKCQVATPVVNTELLEPHGCYERGKQFIGALGGQLQQIYYVVNAILKLYPAQTSLVDYHQKVAEDPKSD